MSGLPCQFPACSSVCFLGQRDPAPLCEVTAPTADTDHAETTADRRDEEEQG